MCGVVLRIARAERPGWFREDRVVIITDAGKRGSGLRCCAGAEALRWLLCVCCSG